MDNDPKAVAKNDVTISNTIGAFQKGKKKLQHTYPTHSKIIYEEDNEENEDSMEINSRTINVINSFNHKQIKYN